MLLKRIKHPYRDDEFMPECGLYESSRHLFKPHKHFNTDINLDRLKIVLTVMKRVVDNYYNFDIESWQNVEDFAVKLTEKDLHGCGTSACIAGWLAVSPEWIESGGTADLETGAPKLLWYSGVDALVEWLDIKDRNFANVLFRVGDIGKHYTPSFYGVRYLDEITPEIVVKKLEEFIASKS